MGTAQEGWGRKTHTKRLAERGPQGNGKDDLVSERLTSLFIMTYGLAARGESLQHLLVDAQFSVLEHALAEGFLEGFKGHLLF